MSLKDNVSVLFNLIKNNPVSYPEAGQFSSDLSRIVQKARATSIKIDADLCKLFAISSLEMWNRAVHSFLISSALTKTSDIWSSVAGYYSSHYTIRAFAHLLGYFSLYNQKSTIELSLLQGGYYCNIKSGRVREHKYYWEMVKKDIAFSNNDFFNLNDEKLDCSDASHRNFSNYVDNISKFKNFNPLKEEDLIQRINFLAGIELSSVPTPSRLNYPDLDNIQLIAYHRIVVYRKMLDDILGGKNRFWNATRNPAWSRVYLNFQITEPTFTTLYLNL